MLARIKCSCPAFDNRQDRVKQQWSEWIDGNTYSALIAVSNWASGGVDFFNEGTKIHSAGTELKNYDLSTCSISLKSTASGWQYTPAATRSHLTSSGIQPLGFSDI